MPMFRDGFYALAVPACGFFAVCCIRSAILYGGWWKLLMAAVFVEVVRVGLNVLSREVDSVDGSS